jgi:hypothetical protein
MKKVILKALGAQAAMIVETSSIRCKMPRKPAEIIASRI